MSAEDHHDTPEQIRACPVCQLLYRLRALAMVEKIKGLLRRGKP